MSYYDGFLQGFHRDIQFIKSYAGPDVLDHLWNSKVSVSDKRTAPRTRGHNERETHRETARSEPTTTFQDMARELCDHLYATMKAAGKARQARDGENAGHVHAKLGKSVKEMTIFLERAPYRAKDTKNLMTELEMLLTFLGANGAGQGNRRETGYGQNQQTQQRYDEQEGSGAYQEEQGTDPTFNESL